MDTLNQSQVACPTCGTVLNVPTGCWGRHVRCGRCGERFCLPTELYSDDDIAAWLDEEPQDQDEQRALIDSPGLLAQCLQAERVRPSMTGPLRLVKVEQGSVLMEFPATRLLEPAFRRGMPRTCIKCSSKSHLYVHVIIFSGHMIDSISLEAEHSAGALGMSDHEVRMLSADDILARLPKVPNVPFPANEPMPYWLCDMCSAAGVVSGQIAGNLANGQGTCRLKINNVRHAQEFLLAVGGAGAEGYDQLEQMISHMVENPWESVPLAVQHRLEQWFKPEPRERFLAYVPDRNLARTEDGMFGIVVSDRRLIYHTDMRHREMHIGGALRITVASHGHVRRIAIRTDSWEVQAMAVDREGMAGLRRALLLGQFPHVWC